MLKEAEGSCQKTQKRIGAEKMAKRRNKMEMSQDEAWNFIDQQKSLQVATLNADGSVHLSTLWFGIVGETNDDKSIVFETYTKSQKIVNLKRDPRIAILLEDGTTYEKLRGITINTTAELVDDNKEVEPFAAAVLLRNNPDWDEKTAKGAAEMLANKRTAVIVKPEKIISWDHTKLGGTY